ncbi:MAG: hypothetical protein Q9163_004429 [Psora crenata]
MAENEQAKVNSADGTAPKHLAPGPNSWAQAHQRQHSVTTDKEEPRPTNRDRYENKLTPKPPSEAAVQASVLQPKAYIQPAIPLVGPPPIPKNRAVTDPVAPKPLFAGRKPSVTQLRKVFGHSKHNSEDDHPLPSSLDYPSGKAAELLGLKPVLVGPKRSTAPSSAVMSSNADVTSDLSNASSSQSPDAVRQVQDTPLPMSCRVGSEDDHHPARDINNSADARKRNGLEQQQKESATSAQPQQQGTSIRLAPPKVASYGKVGEVGVVQGNGMHRVESFQGIIEDGTLSVKSEEQTRVGEDGQTTPKSAAFKEHNGHSTQPVSYSPNNYAGVWENDPAVVSSEDIRIPFFFGAKINFAQGYSLPPFSPMPDGYPQTHTTDGSLPPQTSIANTPSVFGDNYTNASFPSSGQGSAQHFRDGFLAAHNAPRFTEYPLPPASSNSWASGSRNNSFVSGSAPASALLPPRWPSHHLSNSVPSPPQTRQDYQRPDPLSAGLSQLDMTIHHHIDNAFGSLSRLVTDKHDRVLDQVIRRLEDVEDRLGKGFKQMKSDIKGVNSELGKVKTAVHGFNAGQEGLKELLNGLEKKLGGLEQCIEEHKCQCQQIMTNQATSDEGDRQPRSTTHRRTESAHGALGTSQDRERQQNGGSRTSSKVRISNTSSRGHRTSTANSQTSARVSDNRGGARREYFAELGAARGPVPDIREHPAYAGVPQPPSQMYDQNGMPIGMAYTAPVTYGSQQLGDGGWYHQAYGSG